MNKNTHEIWIIDGKFNFHKTTKEGSHIDFWPEFIDLNLNGKKIEFFFAKGRTVTKENYEKVLCQLANHLSEKEKNNPIEYKTIFNKIKLIINQAYPNHDYLEIK